MQRIWRAHGLRPHEVRSFNLCTDPKLATKAEDIGGLYVDPPAHAVVLSIDERSQIRALDRTQPGLPMKKGRAGSAIGREVPAGKLVHVVLDDHSAPQAAKV